MSATPTISTSDIVRQKAFDGVAIPFTDRYLAEFILDRRSRAYDLADTIMFTSDLAEGRRLLDQLHSAVADIKLAEELLAAGPVAP